MEDRKINNIKCFLYRLILLPKCEISPLPPMHSLHFQALQHKNFWWFIAGHIRQSEPTLFLSLITEVHTEDTYVVHPFTDFNSELPQRCNTLQSFVQNACHHSAFLEDRYARTRACCFQ